MEAANYEVLVADGHSLCREGLSNLLLTQLRVKAIYQAHDFASALAALTSFPAIELVSLDMDLPGMRRSEGLRELRVRFPKLRVVAASAVADRRLVLDVLALGVHGCIPKDLPVSEISAAFRTVASGQIYVPSMVCELGSDADRASANRVPPHDAGQSAQLTDRQKEVLRLMAAGRSNKEIARQLCIAEGTVKVHVAAAFKHLKVHNRVSAVSAMRALSLRPEIDLACIPGLFDEQLGIH